MVRIVSFETFVKRHNENKFFKGKKFPKGMIGCWQCDGEGKAYRFEDHDPIEGYKMADKKTCLMCGGSGRLDDDMLLADYAAYKRIYTENNKIEEESKVMLKSIKGKLSYAEKKWLNERYGCFSSK